MFDLFAPPRIQPRLVVLPNGDAVDATTVSSVLAAHGEPALRCGDRVLVDHGADSSRVVMINCADWDEACVMRDEVIKLVQEALS